MKNLNQITARHAREKGFINTFLVIVNFVANYFGLLPGFRRYIALPLYKIFSKITIKEVNGSLMFLDLADSGLCTDLFTRGIREIHHTDFMLKSGVLGKGDVILDIGSNIGYYALLEAKLVGDKGLVYAIEPVSASFEVLKENVMLNKYINIKLFKIALGDVNEVSEIYVTEKRNLSSLRKCEKTVYSEKVNVKTVDSFLQDKKTPNLIRMDVEGYEYNIIKGAQKILEENIKIIMELHEGLMTQRQMKEMFGILKTHGFNIYILLPVVWLPPYCKQFIKYLESELDGSKIFSLQKTSFLKLRKWLRNTGYNLVIYMEKGQ